LRGKSKFSLLINLDFLLNADTLINITLADVFDTVKVETFMENKAGKREGINHVPVG